MRMLILGSNGFLGSNLADYFSRKEEVFKADISSTIKKERLNLTKKKDVFEFMKKINPEIIIDTVALSSSFLSEQNPNLCKKMNFETVKNIVEYCKHSSSKMVFLSSSYVFNGKKGNYSEEDNPNPLNEYGKYKLLAEKEVLKLKNSLVIRADLMYGVYRGSLRAGTTEIHGGEINIWQPFQIRSPIFIKDVVKGIETLVKGNKKGIFHFAGEEKLKMYNFLEELLNSTGYKYKLNMAPLSDILEKYPKDSSLNSSKIKTLGIKTNSIKEASFQIKKELKD